MKYIAFFKGVNPDYYKRDFRYLPKIDEFYSYEQVFDEWEQSGAQYDNFEDFAALKYGFDYWDAEENVIGNWFNPFGKFDKWKECEIVICPVSAYVDARGIWHDEEPNERSEYFVVEVE